MFYLEKVLLTIGFHLATTFGTLPPIEFITDFAKLNDLTLISIHTPTTNISQKNFMSWIKYMSASDCQSMVKVYNSANGTKTNPDRGRTSLNIFIPGPSDLDQSLRIFQKLFNFSTNKDNQVWLLDISSSHVFEILDGITLALDSNLYGFRMENTSVVAVSEFYKIGDSYPVIKQHFASWNSSHGFADSLEDIWLRRSNLMGKHLRVQTLNYYEHIKMGSMQPDGTYIPTGIFAEVFYHLQDILNFTSSVRQPPDGKYGAKNPNGSWNGMVNQLIKDQVDVVIGTLDITLVRSQVMDYTVTLDRSTKQLFIKNPSNNLNMNAYFEPFHSFSWLAIVACCFIAPPILCFSTRFPVRDPQQKEFVFRKSFLFMLSALTNRGWSAEPERAAPRIAMLSLFIATILIYSHWEAKLISFLTTKVQVLPFKSYAELLEKTNYRVFLIPGSANEDYFKLSTDPDIQQVWRDRIQPYLQSYQESGWKEDEAIVARDNFASQITRSGIITSDGYKNCEIVATPQKGIIVNLAFGLQKDSPYTKVFNYYINRMREKGTLKKIMDKYKVGDPVCPDFSGKALGLASCLTAFFPLAFGMILGLALIIFEVVIKKNNFNPNVCLYDVEESDEKSRTIQVESRKQELLDQIADLQTKMKAMETKLENCQCGSIKIAE